MSVDIADQLLNQLFTEAKAESWPVAQSPTVQKLRYTHDAMIDQIIANPAVSQNQLALLFGYTPSWISIIIASDTFQARLAERRKELVDPAILETVENQFQGLVRRSLEVLSEKLNKPSDQIPDQLALRALEVSARAAGYGARDAAPAATPVEVHNHLEVHGDQLVSLLRRKKAQVLENEVEENEPSKD